MPTSKPFGLRIPPDLRKWLEDRAQEDRRSLNSEILEILRAARDEPKAA
jgi:predicted HicB family RNase H-like nuclease